MSNDIDVEFEFLMNSKNYVLSLIPTVTLGDIKEYLVQECNLVPSISMAFVYKDNLYTKLDIQIGSFLLKGDQALKVLINHEIVACKKNKYIEVSQCMTDNDSSPEKKIKITLNNFPKIKCINYNTNATFGIKYNQGMTYGQLNEALAQSTNARIQFTRSNGNPVDINPNAVLQNQEIIYFITIIKIIQILFVVNDGKKTIQRELQVESTEILLKVEQRLLQEFQLNNQATRLDFYYNDNTQITEVDLKITLETMALRKNIERINVKIKYSGGGM